MNYWTKFILAKALAIFQHGAAVLEESANQVRRAGGGTHLDRENRAQGSGVPSPCGGVNFV
jgi:hypothetical protein